MPSPPYTMPTRITPQEESLAYMDDTVPSPLNPPVSPQVFNYEHSDNGFYEGYTVQTTYNNVPGVALLPVASGSCVEVRVCQAITYKTVTWGAVRNNKQPKIPKFDTKNANEKCVSQTLSFYQPQPNGNGGYVHRASGVNVYQLFRPLGEGDKYPIGTTPAEPVAATTRFYGPEHFDDGILDASAGGPA